MCCNSDPDTATWSGYQLHRSAEGDGYFVLFRRCNATAPSFAPRLVGLQPGRKYSLSLRYGYSESETRESSGAALMAGRGLAVELLPMESLLVVYAQATAVSRDV